MAKISVSAKVKDAEGNVSEVRKFSADYDFGGKVEEAIMRFTPEVVYNVFEKKAVIQGQDLVRPLLAAGKSEKEVAAALAKWKPSGETQRARKSVQDKYLEDLRAMSPEARLAAIKELTAKADTK